MAAATFSHPAVTCPPAGGEGKIYSEQGIKRPFYF
jgi:hypothetical protein